MTIKTVLEKWLKKLEGSSFPEFESLPDINLYMQQVLAIMDQTLALFENSMNDKLITKPMINNYVKDGILPKPEMKKYSKDQLVRLFQISILKSVLPLKDIETLLDYQYTAADTASAYANFNDLFVDINNKMFTRVLADVADIKPNDEDSFLDLALKLSLHGFSAVLAARKIIYLVNQFRGISKITNEINKEEVSDEL